MQTLDLVSMSLTGAGMATAVLVARVLLLRRLPKQTFVVLWALVALRLLVPVAIPVPVNAYSMLYEPAQAVGEKVRLLFGQVDTGSTATPESTAGFIDEEGGSTATVGSPSISQVARGSVERLPGFVRVAWGVGALVTAGAFLVTHARLKRRLAESLPVRDEEALEAFASVCKRVGVRRRVALRQSELVGTPLTYGVFRPVVVVPKGCPDEEGWAGERTCLVLAHELCHVRRCDVALKCLLAAAVCLHWFNPLAWVMWVLAARDVELACDEAAVRSQARGPLGQVRAEYARALIDMEEIKSGLAPFEVCSAFKKTAIEERVVAIMHIKKTTCAALLASSLLVAGVPAAFASTTYWGLPSGGQAWHFTYGADSVEVTAEGDATVASEGETAAQAVESGAHVFVTDVSDGVADDAVAPGMDGDSAVAEVTATDVGASDDAVLGVTMRASESGAAVASEDSQAPRAADYADLEQLFAPYAKYGLAFDAKTGALTYADPADRDAKPQAVSAFVDTQDAGDELSNAFVYSDGAGDGLKLRTVYSKAGTLTGLEEFEGDLGFDLPEE